MTITIELTPKEEAQLLKAAKLEGMEPKAFVENLVSTRLPQSSEKTFAEILSPVHAYSREQSFTEEEIGEFVDSEVSAYRRERRAMQKTKPVE